ncbi:MAG: hypothetical protein ABI402_06540 [Ferruginibacter sp.]
MAQLDNLLNTNVAKATEQYFYYRWLKPTVSDAKSAIIGIVIIIKRKAED